MSSLNSVLNFNYKGTNVTFTLTDTLSAQQHADGYTPEGTIYFLRDGDFKTLTGTTTLRVNTFNMSPYKKAIPVMSKGAIAAYNIVTGKDLNVKYLSRVRDIRGDELMLGYIEVDDNEESNIIAVSNIASFTQSFNVISTSKDMYPCVYRDPVPELSRIRDLFLERYSRPEFGRFPFPTSGFMDPVITRSAFGFGGYGFNPFPGYGQQPEM